MTQIAITFTHHGTPDLLSWIFRLLAGCIIVPSIECVVQASKPGLWARETTSDWDVCFGHVISAVWSMYCTVHTFGPLRTLQNPVSEFGAFAGLPRASKVVNGA